MTISPTPCDFTMARTHIIHIYIYNTIMALVAGMAKKNNYCNWRVVQFCDVLLSSQVASGLAGTPRCLGDDLYRDYFEDVRRHAHGLQVKSNQLMGKIGGFLLYVWHCLTEKI